MWCEWSRIENNNGLKPIQGKHWIKIFSDIALSSVYTPSNVLNHIATLLRRNILKRTLYSTIFGKGKIHGWQTQNLTCI